MSEFKSSSFRNEDNSGAPDIVGVSTFTSPFYFVPPSGTTSQRPSGDGLAPGMLRFNTDIGRLEVWRGDHWATILGESSNLNGGARGLIAGGGSSPNFNENTIEYITISTLGNAQDFGDLTGLGSGYRTQGLANQTRGVFGGGYGNALCYVTISSTGNALDFGDSINTSGQNGHGVSNQVRGIFGGGGNGNVLEYITINSTGNAVDFGDLSSQKENSAAASSSTRAIYAGGITSPNITTNAIDYITISTTGNSVDFGDLTVGGVRGGGASNGTRMLIAGTFYTSPSTAVNDIQFLTIATLGNTQDFGEVDGFSALNCKGASSPTRAVWAGGYMQSNIGYTNISSTGNMMLFGYLSVSPTGRLNHTIVSNAHGGL
jgi:hypothetical protein